MALYSLEHLLDQLEQASHSFGRNGGEPAGKLLAAIGRRSFSDVDLLIRFHELLLFIRAYPQSRAIFQLANKLLSEFHERVAQIQASGVDESSFDFIENSGIAGTALYGRYSYGIARWLTESHYGRVEIDWDRYEKNERLAYVWPRLLPLLEEDSLVEQNIPYLTWLHSAKPRAATDLRYLVERFDRLAVPSKERSALYDSLELWLRWNLGESKASRTNNRTTPHKVFYHTGPLIRRSEVSLDDIIPAPLGLESLSPGLGQAVINRCRETSCVRYRELYGIAYGDPSSVVRAEIGRGVEIYLWGLPPDRRLPLRAYHAGFTLKNGVPINYIEGITLFERMEIGFNTFYTYRDGETAWVYAQVLRMLHHLTGASCFSIDPYQIGLNNDEAIESGAFWFYRKLGFRPTRRDLMSLVEREEKKIAAGRGHRTSARILRRLAEAPMLFEMAYRGASPGEWNEFRIRNLGLAVQRRAALQFKGEIETLRVKSIERVGHALELNPWKLKGLERLAFDNLALVLDLIPDLADWSRAEKRQMDRIIRAKSGADDAAYARLLQRHARLRKALILIGSDRDRR
ncbi:MAG TPA: hypothetical protein VKJ45_19780 [Blastocatellia bacterium]|nr:hypothetical protein [Blastocatellia bacterium]